MARLRISKDEHRAIAAALRALRTAQRVANTSGVTRSVVRNGKLVSISPAGEIKVIRELPPRRVIDQRRVTLNSDSGTEKKKGSDRILLENKKRSLPANQKSRLKKLGG